MTEREQQAPGRPGLTPRWTSSAKSGVGTGLTIGSRVWFTISHGILNEVYYPRVDAACTRDLGLIVTAQDPEGGKFFSEEKRHAEHAIALADSGVPAFELVNTCVQGRYRITKRIIADPARDVLLQEIDFTALRGTSQDYRVFALLAPHLVNAGAGNTGWIDTYKGDTMLFAEGRGTVLALASSVPWKAASVGFVGFSDGWQALSRDGYLSETWTLAEDGNIALTGEIDFGAKGAQPVVLALGFGARAEEAAHRARASLQHGFGPAWREYVENWQRALSRIEDLHSPGRAGRHDPYRTSVGVMLAHEPPSFPGATIASLSIPWGFAKGDDDLGGYHLVWPRDLVETAGGLLAAGCAEEARDVLGYLRAVQEPDGHWPQNMWLDGRPYWGGIQLDECAFPILLVELLEREDALGPGEIERYLPMIENAARFIVGNGPVTAQDRWEEDAGYSPFTLAVTIAALVAAAAFVEATRGLGDPVARYLRETADAWNEGIDGWIYATGTDLAHRLGIEGYYVRIATPDSSDCASPVAGFVAIKNRPPGDGNYQAAEIVSADALALVRFGLRAADDPRILGTVAAIDHLTRVELPQGPLWHRYNFDGYGEHADGRAFDGAGIGRAWPLLAGERGHYALAAGRPDEARALLETLEASSGETGLLPEQVWDADDIPNRELFRGKPSGSAMPLVWAHSEHVKLLRSLRDGRVFDLPRAAAERYRGGAAAPVSPFAFWRHNHKCRDIPSGKALRIELRAPATIHWSADHWATALDVPTRDSGLGLHYADLPAFDHRPGAVIRFTFYWPGEQRWEGLDYEVAIIPNEPSRAPAG